MSTPADPTDDALGLGEAFGRDIPPGERVDLASALSQMTGLVLSRETVDTALHLVTSLAATVTAGTLGAGVTVVDSHGTRSRAASNAATEAADALQYELDEGPCLTAWRTRQVVRVDDTATDDRWPRWNSAAARLGVRSVLSAPLVIGDEAIGAMKIYGGLPAAYGPHDEDVMRLLAGQAAILLSNSQSLAAARAFSRQLTRSLHHRDAVSRATGVLMGRGSLDGEGAFAALVAIARESGRPVAVVAHALLTALDARRDPGATAGGTPPE